jgi:hypothetical protein
MPEEAQAVDLMDTNPHFVFWREGCAKFVGSTCRLLRLAGEPVTRETITGFILTAPRMKENLTEFQKLFRGS